LQQRPHQERRRGLHQGIGVDTQHAHTSMGNNGDNLINKNDNNNNKN
jgi:hypothetical protein